MENTLINNSTPNIGEQYNHLDKDLVFVDPQENLNNIAANEHKANTIKQKALDMRSARNKDEKFTILLSLKRMFPDMSLRDFCYSYVKMDNNDHIDDYENNEIADNVEDYFLKKFRKKLKRTVKKVGKGIKKVSRYTPLGVVTSRKTRMALKKAGKKTLKAAGKVAKRLVGYTILLPLRPLLPSMRKALKGKGYSTSKSTPLVDVATQFFKRVVRGKGKNFEELDDYWYENDPSFYEEIDNMEENHIAATTVTMIVTAIISYYKNAKKKAKEGVKLSTVEMEAADDLQIVEDKLNQKAASEIMQQQANTEKKAQGIDTKTILIIGVIVAAIALLK